MSAVADAHRSGAFVERTPATIEAGGTWPPVLTSSSSADPIKATGHQASGNYPADQD